MSFKKQQGKKDPQKGTKIPGEQKEVQKTIRLNKYIVITSYSIHYTKLYEISLKRYFITMINYLSVITSYSIHYTKLYEYLKVKIEYMDVIRLLIDINKLMNISYVINNDFLNELNNLAMYHLIV